MHKSSRGPAAGGACGPAAAVPPRHRAPNPPRAAAELADPTPTRRDRHSLDVGETFDVSPYATIKPPGLDEISPIQHAGMSIPSSGRGMGPAQALAMGDLGARTYRPVHRQFGGSSTIVRLRLTTPCSRAMLPSPG